MRFRDYCIPMMLCLAALAACTRVTAEIERTSALPSGGGETFAIMPLSGQLGSPEFERYAEQVEEGLAAKGYVRASDPAKADYRVSLRYGAGLDSTAYVSRSVFPSRRRDPTATRLDTQPIRGATEKQTNLAPLTDAIGQPSHLSRTLYRRAFQIDMVDARRPAPQDHEPAFSGRAETVGQQSDLSLVAPCLIDAILGKSGESGRSTVTFESESCDR